LALDVKMRTSVFLRERPLTGHPCGNRERPEMAANRLIVGGSS
jgi:hypothetical protein